MINSLAIFDLTWILAQTSPGTEPASWFAANFSWLKALLFYNHGAPSGVQVAHTCLVLGLVIALGLAIGSIRIANISLGIGGVLFAGLAFAHFGMSAEPHVLHFVREFGLILFVYTIGMQVGPGVLSSLRKSGLKLNLLAAAIVVLGVAITLTIVNVSQRAEDARYRMDVPVGIGLLSGAVTNTPSLAAAQQAIMDVQASGKAAAAAAPAGSAADIKPGKVDATKVPSMAYALAYPFGIMGIILTMLLIRGLFRVNIGQEIELFNKLQGKGSGLDTINLEVTNPNLDTLQLCQVPVLNQPGLVVSRILKGDKPIVAQHDTVIRKGDILHVVGPREKFDELKLVVGGQSQIDVKQVPSDITTRRMVVTKREAIGKTIEELGLTEKFDVTISRVARAEVEMACTPSWRFQFGDVVLVVGQESNIKAVSAVLGDQVRKLDHPHMIPVFVGIGLGVILGSWPIYLPNLPVPVKMGLAGGPLLVAIILSRIGQIGPLSWYMPRSANFTLREFGITLFLACVGLLSGDEFVSTLVEGPGLYWMAMAAIITLAPLLLVGLAGRIFLRLNYVTLCGVLSGSMTDPPALAFANAIVGNETPSISYATVYPLTMILRVVCAQAIVLLFCT